LAKEERGGEKTNIVGFLGCKVKPQCGTRGRKKGAAQGHSQRIFGQGKTGGKMEEKDEKRPFIQRDTLKNLPIRELKREDG